MTTTKAPNVYLCRFAGCGLEAKPGFTYCCDHDPEGRCPCDECVSIRRGSAVKTGSIMGPIPVLKSTACRSCGGAGERYSYTDRNGDEVEYTRVCHSCGGTGIAGEDYT